MISLTASNPKKRGASIQSRVEAPCVLQLLERLVNRLGLTGKPGNFCWGQGTIIDANFVNGAEKEAISMRSTLADTDVRIGRDIPDVLRADRISTLSIL